MGAAAAGPLLLAHMSANDKAAALRDQLTALARRRRPLLLTFIVGVVATALLALLLPPSYRSAGTILIEQQEMPQDVVRSAVTSYADQRVQVISQRVMTTETLFGIIRRYDLYQKLRASDTREAVLKRMRKDIGLHMISADVIDPRSGRPTAATIAFEVSYLGSSAELAAKVANELATLYLNENLTSRTKLAQDATTFLESEGERLNRQIADLEAQLAKFKEKHQDELPDFVVLNMQLLDRTQQQLHDLETKQTSLEQQRTYLQAQLAQLKPNSQIFSETGERILSSADRLKMLRSQLAEARARYAPEHPDIARLEREVAGLEKEVGPSSSPINDLRRSLQNAEAELAQAREHYAPDHPDRIRLEREVPALQAQLAAATPTNSAAVDAPQSVGQPKEADNPAYVQIQAQLSAADNDLSALAGQIQHLHGQIGVYQKKISLSPEVEQQFREMMRDYDSARIKYQEVRSKQLEAKASQELEADRKGERFTLIEPPLPPEEPVSPNRPLILIAGCIVSIGLAVVVFWLLEKLDLTIRSRDELLRLVGAPPLALVPYIGTNAEFRASRRRVQLAAVTAAGVVFIAITLTHLFYQPIDVLWFQLVRRMGL